MRQSGADADDQASAHPSHYRIGFAASAEIEIGGQASQLGKRRQPADDAFEQLFRFGADISGAEPHAGFVYRVVRPALAELVASQHQSVFYRRVFLLVVILQRAVRLAVQQLAVVREQAEQAFLLESAVERLVERRKPEQPCVDGDRPSARRLLSLGRAGRYAGLQVSLSLRGIGVRH